MNPNRFLLAALLFAALLVPSALGQVLPVTTASEEARDHFEAGRIEAFYWQGAQAQEHLNAAIAADSAFILAYLHLAGTSPPGEREPYLVRAEAYRGHATDAEQRMVDAFRAFLVEEDYARAIAILQALSEEYPDDPYLHGYLGMRYYSHLQNYEEAARHFRRALERDSTFTPAHQLLGWAALRRGDFTAAEEYFLENLRRAPERWRAHYSLAMLRLRQGRPDDAIPFFERAAALDPSGGVRNDLGYTYLEAERYEDAERVFRENIRLHPDDPNVYDSLGDLYLRQRRYDEAATQFKQALQIDPSLELSRTNLARAEIERKTAAWADAMVAGTVPDLIPNLFTEGAVRMGAGRQQQGRDAILAHARKFPTYGGAVFYLDDLVVVGDVAYATGRYTIQNLEGEEGEGTFLKVWRYEADGEWRIDRIMFQ